MTECMRKVLRGAENAHLAPAELAPLGKDVLVAHDGARSVEHLLVNVVGDDEIGRILELHLKPQILHHGRHRVGVEPIVRIDHFEVTRRSPGKPRIDRRAVPAVLLVDRLDDVGMTSLPFIRLLGGVVLRRTVVDDEDLDIVTAREEGFYAFVHVIGGIVARYRERERFHSALPIPKPAPTQGGMHVAPQARQTIRGHGRRSRPCCSNDTRQDVRADGNWAAIRSSACSERNARCSPR